MAEGRTANALRTLGLALNLVNTEVGLTRRQIQLTVPEYGQMEPETFRRTFERDVASLRATGLEVTVSSDARPRYRVSGSSFSSPDVTFDASEAELLVQAASAWTGMGQTEQSLLLMKLGALVNDPIVPRSVAEYNLEGLEYLAQIARAIEIRQPVRFTYASRGGTGERDVAPWSLIFRGRAVYLLGFDLNRWSPRRFRLSRITSPLEYVAEPDTYEIPPGAQEDYERSFFQVAPLLWVRQGEGNLVRIRAGSPLTQDEYPDGLTPRVGWDLVLGHEDDQAVWEQLLLADCLHTMPAENSALRRRLVGQLRAAADWGGRA